MSPFPEQCPYQCRFAGTEIAVEVDDQAGVQDFGQRRTEFDGLRFAGEEPRGRHVRLRAMHEKHSVGNRDWAMLARKIKGWAQELGFADSGIARADTGSAVPGLMRWLALGRHGEMDYMAKHAPLRAAPEQLVPGVLSVISVRLPYWPESAAEATATLADASLGYVSRYALGRDYHKPVRNRLQKLADLIRNEIGDFSYRAFSDSAPVMEVEFARLAGTAWRGKHSLSLTRRGSYHFLGELYTDLPLPEDTPVDAHCGTCAACIDACPTRAIVAPYEVDARRCISYLTIELSGPIPEDLRPLMGNRIYGCDDCQLCCPWNRFAVAGDPDFVPRHNLDTSTLVDLFAWNEADFEYKLQGSPIRRIGHERWLRNIAVALGNASTSEAVVLALCQRAAHPSALVREHVAWALARHRGNSSCNS